MSEADSVQVPSPCKMKKNLRHEFTVEEDGQTCLYVARFKDIHVDGLDFRCQAILSKYKVKGTPKVSMTGFRRFMLHLSIPEWSIKSGQYNHDYIVSFGMLNSDNGPDYGSGYRPSLRGRGMNKGMIIPPAFLEKAFRSLDEQVWEDYLALKGEQ